MGRIVYDRNLKKFLNYKDDVLNMREQQRKITKRKAKRKE